MDYLLWELPIAQFCQLLHAHLYFEGMKVRRTRQLKNKEVKDLEKLLGVS